MTTNSINHWPLLAVGLILILLVVFAWVRLWPHVQGETLHRKDFAQLYEMGKAARDGESVYDPLPHTGHASAYPPAMAILMVPLSLVSYRTAFVVWIAIETFCFLVALVLIVVNFKEPKQRFATLIVAALFTLWWPFFVDLYHGQVMMLVLLLLTCAWLSLRSGRDVVGGVCLGIILALKLYAWPILLLLVILKRCRAAASATVIFVALNLIAVLWIGMEQLNRYVFVVGPSLSKIYRDHPLNFSAFSIGAGQGVVIGVLFAVAILCAALLMARTVRDFDRSFMIMLIASAILSPVSWVHYFVTFLPAICLFSFQLSLPDLIALMGLGLLSVADALYLTPLFPPSVLRPLPLLFTIGLMGFAYLNEHLKLRSDYSPVRSVIPG